MTQITTPAGTFTVATGKTHPGYSIATFAEEQLFRDMHWRPQQGDVCVDVGAAYGAYTLPALAAGATVHAFEPVRDVCNDLRRNVELNGWRPRCAVYEFGLLDALGTIQMKEYAPHWPAGTAEEPFTVDTLDNWATRTKIGRLDWLKMDIEGAEERAIRGGLETIERLRPVLIVECHTFLDADLPRKIRALLPGYSFDEYPREPCVMLVGRAA